MRTILVNLKQLLTEGVFDKGILKAVFMAGGPGSGKSYVAGKATGGLGMKVVNSDDIYELKLKSSGLGMDFTKFDDKDFERSQVIRDRAKKLTKMRMRQWVDGRLGMIIDGTGKDYAKIKKTSDSLRKIGYDTYMMFVNTSLDTAQQRNKMRERQLDEDEVAEMWKAVQSNMGKFQRYFGREQFILIDNNNATEKIFDKVYVEIGKLIDKKPSSRAAHAWIKSQRP